MAHHLIREALDIAGSNSRSAVVIAVAAAEVGFKQLVAILVPDAQWLISKVPSPPLTKMLKEYLPKLPARCTVDGQVLPPPRFVRTLVSEAVEARNTIAHAGMGQVTGERLTATLEAIRDLLYLFDFYAGQEWAYANISEEFRDGLGP